MLENYRILVSLGLCFSKPTVIFLLEQGQEPWTVRTELTDSSSPGWECVCETEELIPKQELDEEQPSGKKNEELRNLDLDYPSLVEEPSWGHHFKRQYRNLKACLKEESMAFEASIDNRSWGSFHQNTLLHTSQTSPDETAQKEGTHQKIWKNSAKPLKHLHREETSEMQRL